MPAAHMPGTWQELLRELLWEDGEREQSSAPAEGVCPTVLLWGAGTPRDHEGPGRARIPTRFYAEALRAARDTEQRFWTVSSLVLHQMLIQLDPQRLGMEITLACCMPPRSDGKVRSLCCVCQGTPPWTAVYLQEKPLLLGAESLAGYAIAQGRGVATGGPGRRPEQTDWLGGSNPFARSQAAFPVSLWGNIAGCVLATSTQGGHFTPARLRLLGEYATLLRVAFRDADYYPPDAIALGPLPPWGEQQPYFSGLELRSRALQQQALGEERVLDALTAAGMVRQEIEAELLRLAGGGGNPT
jgi:hypothetical protein